MCVEMNGMIVDAGDMSTVVSNMYSVAADISEDIAGMVVVIASISTAINNIFFYVVTCLQRLTICTLTLLTHISAVIADVSVVATHGVHTGRPCTGPCSRR